MRFRSAATHVSVLLLVVALGGCATQSKQDEPITLEVAGPISVDVQSFGGHVFIEANESFEETEISVVRKATHGYKREKEAKASLSEIDYSIEIVPAELGQTLQIRTSTTHVEPYFQRADVYVKTPQVEGVFVRTRDGKVEIRGVEGPVDVVTSNENVRVLTDRPMRRTVRITNENGDIIYRIRAESTGDFYGKAVRGQVIQHTEYGKWFIGPGSDHDTLRATLNDGTNRIELNTKDGDILVSVVENPEDVGWIIKE
jgi:hypothetical protein